MTILVTGANSCLGTNLIPLLAEKGWTVRGLLRSAAGYKGPRYANLDLIEGDFTSGECLRSVLPGCRAVIHTAALTSRGERNYGRYHDINVKGTRRLIEAAIHHGVKRFVEIASDNCFGYGSREIPGCELNEMSEPFASSYYVRSKYEALLASMSYRDMIEVVGIAPALMLGPFDAKPGCGQIITRAYKKKIIFYPPGGRSFVHTGDVAAGIVKALEKGVPGETYLLCSENLTYREFYKKLDAVTGNRAFHIRIPRIVMYAAGGIGSFLRVMGMNTPVSLPDMRILCVSGWYHNYKACRDLGIQFRPTERALRDAVEWFFEEGMLQPCKLNPVL